MKPSLHLVSLLLLLASCAGETSKSTAVESDTLKETQAPFPSILPMLQRSWVETRDSLHVVDLSNMYWTDMYNGDTVSVRPYQLYDKDPAMGGALADHGRYLYLKEDSSNFYLMEIEALDSGRLALHFLQAQTRYEFRPKEVKNDQ
jgi:hypothetical protein